MGSNHRLWRRRFWVVDISTISGATTNTTEIQYFWGVDMSNTLQGAGGVGGLLAVSRNGDFYFPTYDNNGNVTKYRSI